MPYDNYARTSVASASTRMRVRGAPTPTPTCICFPVKTIVTTAEIAAGSPTPESAR